MRLDLGRCTASSVNTRGPVSCLPSFRERRSCPQEQQLVSCFPPKQEGKHKQQRPTSSQARSKNSQGTSNVTSGCNIACFCSIPDSLMTTANHGPVLKRAGLSQVMLLIHASFKRLPWLLWRCSGFVACELQKASGSLMLTSSTRKEDIARLKHALLIPMMQMMRWNSD